MHVGIAPQEVFNHRFHYKRQATSINSPSHCSGMYVQYDIFKTVFTRQKGGDEVQSGLFDFTRMADGKLDLLWGHLGFRVNVDET